MSADKYPSIFSRQMEAIIVYIYQLHSHCAMVSEGCNSMTHCRHFACTIFIPMNVIIKISTIH